MNRTLLLACTGALALALGFAPASAAPTQAANHQVVEMTCEQLGPIAIEVVNRGHWGAAKIQGTTTTLLQAWAEETVWFDGEVVHEDRHARGNDTIDDTCRLSWSEDLGEQDVPPGFPTGTYDFEVETGVKIRGR